VYIDRKRWYKNALWVALAVYVVCLFGASNNSILLIAILAVANAIFHVAAGAMIFHALPQKAAPSGVFASFGALGIFLGTTLGSLGVLSLWQLGVLFVVLLGAFIPIIEPATLTTDVKQKQDTQVYAHRRTILLGALLLILCWSAVGLAISFPWKTENTVLFSLFVTSVCFGRLFGGFVYDVYRSKKVLIGALVCGGVCIALGYQYVVFGMVGLLLFNFLIAMCSVMISEMYWQRSAFAFSLISIAILLGFGVYYVCIVYTPIVAPVLVAGSIAVMLCVAYLLRHEFQEFDWTIERCLK